MKAPLPLDENKRLEVLRAYRILDTPAEQEFDDLTRLAAQICGTPMSAITLIEEHRQWLKSKVGIEVDETSRDDAFCAHTILGHDLLQVPDATADSRFLDNVQVTGDSHIRFYAGVPLETIEGQRVGALCVVDTVPRDLEASQLEALRILGGQIVALMERRRALTQVLESESFLNSTLDALSSHVAVLDADGTIIAVNRAWREFAAQNEGVNDSTNIGANYIEVCQNARGLWSEGAGEAAAGIRLVIAGTQPHFSLEYPCHSPSQQRWFKLTVTRFSEAEPVRVTVTHENITQRKLAEIAVRQSEQEQIALASQLKIEKERLVAAQEVAKIGSWETDLSTKDVSWSAETYRIYRLAPDEFSPTYDAIQLMVHPDDREEIDRAFEESLKAGGSHVIEHRIMLAEGETKILEQNWRVEHDEQRNPIRVFGTTQDITLRKKAEQQLRHQAHLLNVVGQAVIVTDQAGVINYWNDYAGQLYGWSAAEALGRNIIDVTPTDVTKSQAKEIMGYLVRGESWEGEFRARKRDGTEFSIHVTDTPVLDEVGNVQSIIGISHDISERKRTEDDLRESEERFRAVVEQAGVGICLVGKDYRFQRVNQRFCEIVGHSAQELLSSNNCVETTHPDDRDADAAAVEKLLAGAKSVTVEKRYVSPNQSIVWARLTLSLLRSLSGEPEQFIGVIEDITERQLAEQQLRANEKQLDTIYNSVGDMIIYLDVEAPGRYRFLSTNNATLVATGLEADQIIGRLVSEVIPEPSLSLVLGKYEQAIAENRTVRWEEITPYPTGLRTADVSITPLYDEAGVCTHLVGTIHDITEGREAEEARRQSELQFRAVFENALDGIVISDNQGRFQEANAAACEIYGTEREQLLRMKLSDFIEADPNLPQRVQHFPAAHVKKGEMSLVLPDETRKYVEFASTADFLPQRYLIALRDITESKGAQEAIGRLAAIVQSSSDAIIGKTLDGLVTSWNDGAQRLYGYSAEEMIGRQISILFAAERTNEEAELLAKIARGDNIANYETVRIRKNGSPIDVSLTLSPVTNEANDIIGASVIARDITAQKAAAADQAHLAAIVNSSSDAIISWTPDGIINTWNEGAESLYGYSLEEARGRSIKMLIPPERMDETQELFAKIRRGETTVDFETVRLHKNGHRVNISLTLSPLMNESGEVLGASGISRNISERKQAEMALRASERQFRAFMDNTPARVFIKDREGRYVYLNKAIEQFRKSTVEALQGQTVYDDFPLSIAEPLHHNDLRVFTSGQPQQFEELVTSPDGERHYEIVSKFILPDTEGHQLLAGISVDVTEQRKAEHQRDRFFSLSLDMLCISGFDGYFQRVNPAFTLALGLSEEELLTLPFVDFVHPDDVKATQQAVRKLARGGALVGFENRYRHKDGSWHWLEWKAIAELQDGLIYAAAHDITERKAAQASLLQMRDELEARVEQRTAELVRINAELTEQILEREHAESVVRAQARQQEVVAELGQRALAGTEIESLFSGGIALISVILEADVSSILELLPDGESLLIRAGVGVPEDAVGHGIISALPDTMAGYALKIGKPVIVENLRQETRFTPAPLALEQGVVSSVNVLIPDGDKPFGLICCGSTRGRLFNQDDVHFLQAVANVLAVALTRAKVEREILELNTQLQEGNEKLRVENIEHQMTMGILRTTAQSLEAAIAEANAANLAKSEFLSRMSHELRTPLNAILGFGQILERKKLDELSRESLGYILKGGRHLLDLINEILDISRVEAGRVDLSLEPIALNDILPDACALVRPLAKERAIRLTENWATLGSTHVLADHQRLKQVLLNLLSNAIKYNREGGEVEVLCQQNAQGRLLIAVRDTGPGIAPQDLSKLFTPFERLEAGNSTVEGTGLGLALSERLVAAMNGTLSVESRVGQGTTFTVELPQATLPAKAAASSSGPSTSTESSSHGTGEKRSTLLCIEDNPSNLRLVQSILEDRPEITLLTAIQGSVGIDLARQHEPDVILLDLNLPDIHGSEVLTRLQHSALTRDIPVVVVSADATTKQIEKLLAAGAKAYLTKPLDIDQFLKTIQELL